MDENESSISSAEIGRYLMLMREQAGLTQAELAQRIFWNADTLSRVECGEHIIDLDQAQEILKLIDSNEALAVSKALTRSWGVLQRPPIDHPDQEILWEAEQVAADLQKLSQQPDTPHAFERRLSEYIEELKRCALLLLKRDHQVAFIGSIGIGKSTAICKMTGLEVPKEDGTLIPVLEVGGGGITVCEVHLRTGTEFGLLIEPRSEDEIRQDVGDLVDHIFRNSSQQDTGANESQGISKEVSRALRNMAQLSIVRKKNADGKSSILDPAKKLAEGCSNSRELVVEILSRMELHKRDRREIYYDKTSGKLPKAWLRETFSAINNGRHPEVTLPKRIEVIVPERLLDVPDLTVRLIDTKGIDRTAAREDIEIHLDDPHTLAILCSKFNDAPSIEARLLLERAKAAGVRNLEVNAALLVLPRPSEAMAMKDDATSSPVETSEEGYELKSEQATMALEPIGLNNFAIGFYNANEDNPNIVCEFLIQRLNQVRQAFRSRTLDAIQGARGVLKNHSEERVRAVLRDASETLHTWINSNKVVTSASIPVQENLLFQIQDAYAATVRATVRREGNWEPLSYTHHIGYGARLMAMQLIGPAVEQFKGHCKLLIDTPRYAEAIGLITQAERVLVINFEEIIRNAQSMGQSIFSNAWKNDIDFWQTCIDEWGQGPGYKIRVGNHNKEWFDNESRRLLGEEIKVLIGREWAQTLHNVSSLLEPLE